MPNHVPEIDEWMPAALALASAEFKSPVPFWAFHGEAVDVANFHRDRWEPSTIGERRLPGLKSAVKRGSLLSEKTGDEIRALELAAHELNNRYRETFRPGEPSPIERAQFLDREIRAALGYLLDDGVSDARDVQLAKIDADHADDPESQDALALRLDDYGRFARAHAKELDGLGGFDVRHIDEALELAVTLRDRPRDAFATSDATRAALDLRNRFLILLDERIAAVRAAAQYVFRDHPDIARKATSAYVRKQRAEHRAAARRRERETVE